MTLCLQCSRYKMVADGYTLWCHETNRNSFLFFFYCHITNPSAEAILIATSRFHTGNKHLYKHVSLESSLVITLKCRLHWGISFFFIAGGNWKIPKAKHTSFGSSLCQTHCLLLVSGIPWLCTGCHYTVWFDFNLFVCTAIDIKVIPSAGKL